MLALFGSDQIRAKVRRVVMQSKGPVVALICVRRRRAEALLPVSTRMHLTIQYHWWLASLHLVWTSGQWMDCIDVSVDGHLIP